MTKYIAIFDFRGGATNSLENIERHLKYSQFLEKETNNEYKILVFTTRSPAAILPTNFIVSSDNLNPIKYILNIKNYIKTRNLDIRLIVTGDPWESSWIAYIFKFLFINKVKIQVQIHADIECRKYKYLSITNFLRFLTWQYSAKRSDSLRLVSRRQAKAIFLKSGELEKKSRIIPLSLNLVHNLNAVANTNKSILILGRLSKDRGIKYIPKLIKSIVKLDPSYTFHLVGGGKLEKWLIHKLENNIKKGNVIFYGTLNMEQIASLWHSFSIILSLAPCESYGMGLREAYLNRLSVLSLKNNGATDLFDLVNGEAIEFIEYPIDPNKIYSSLEHLRIVKPGQVNVNRILNNELVLKEKLIDTWLETLEKKA